MALTATAWLAEVRRHGGTVQLDARRRIGVSPRSALTAALRTALPALRPAIVARLVGCGTVREQRDADATTFPCPGCRRRLPIIRRSDRDFTVCVCCKLDATTARLAALAVAAGDERGESDR